MHHVATPRNPAAAVWTARITGTGVKTTLTRQQVDSFSFDLGDGRD